MFLTLTDISGASLFDSWFEAVKTYSGQFSEASEPKGF